MASSSSAASSGGSDGRTVKLRRAFIPADATHRPWRTGEADATSCSRRVRSRPMAHEVAGRRRAEAKQQPVTVETIVVPDPGPGEALVQVQACGVCHTDLHYREGGINDDFPFLLGHEAAGVVEAVGPDVTDVAPGDFVILNWRAVCGECRSCRRGRPWYCFTTHNATQKMTLDGVDAVARRSASAPSPRRRSWPPASAPRCRPTVKPEVAGLLGCGVMAGLGAAMLTGEVGRGDSVAVFGCGGVGDAAIAGARLAGAAHDHRRRPRRPEARAGQGVRRHPHRRRVEHRPGRGDPGAHRRQRRRRVHRGGRQPEGVRAGVLRPRPGRHRRAGRRARTPRCASTSR